MLSNYYFYFESYSSTTHTKYVLLHYTHIHTSTSPMSRHRNVRNLDEDDYYDDYYDEDYDEEEYYLELQREKERKQKEAAAKKAKQNQLKQQQKQKRQQEQNQQQQKQPQQPAKNTPNKQSGASGGGFSIASGSSKGLKKGAGISFSVVKSSPPPGLTVQRSKKSDSQESSIIVGNNKNGADAYQAPIPQTPPNVLAALRSLGNNRANNNKNNKNDNNKNNNNNVRSHLSLVILGHVDAGKSTLTGRLLLALRHVSARLLEKYRKASTAIGKSSFALAWFTDEDDSERERGVTIDIATKFVRTERFDITILDAPGHKDFIPNAISGAASADCGLLVVAATTGEFEAGFARGTDASGSCATVGQTREHVVLSRGLGVTQFVVAVSKLDAAEPAWSQGRFEDIRARVLDFLKENGFKEKKITFVPVSGLTGVNVSRDETTEDPEGWEKLRRWYKGPTLVEALDGFTPAKREFEKPLRAIVTDVSSEGKNATVRGRVVQGFVRAGDGIVVLPVGDEANVVRVERGKATPYSFAPPNNVAGSQGSAEKEVEDIPELRNCALAGDIVETTLSGIDPARLSPGCVLCHPHPSLRPRVRRKFEARILVMERLGVPVIRGTQVLLHMHSVDVPAVLSRLVSSEKRGGTKNHDNKPRQNPRVLTGGATATVEITLSERLVIEESSECKALGRFVLRRGGDTIAVGLIDKVLD